MRLYRQRLKSRLSPWKSAQADFDALSRGFIPGGIVIPSGMETRPPHVLASAGTQVPPQPMEVRSSRLSCLEQGIYPRRNCDTVGYGDPTYARLESVLADLHIMSRGIIPSEIVIPSGMETRHTRRVRNEFRVTACIPKFISGLMRDILSDIETRPTKAKSFYPIEWKNLFAFYTHFVSFRIKSEMCRKPSPNVSGLLFKVQYQ